MNLNSHYKFVDDCKDKYDSIISLLDLEGDAVALKNNFFDKLNALVIDKLLSELSEDFRKSILDLLKTNDYIQIQEKVLTHFTEKQMEDAYVENFKMLIRKMFESANFDSIRSQVESILELTTAPETIPQAVTTA